MFSTLLSRHHFVLIDVGNLGNPTVRIAVVGVEGLFLKNQFLIAFHFAHCAKVVGDGMEFHLLVFQNFVLQGTSLGSDRRSGKRWKARRFPGCAFVAILFPIFAGRREVVAPRLGGQVFD